MYLVGYIAKSIDKYITLSMYLYRYIAKLSMTWLNNNLMKININKYKTTLIISSLYYLFNDKNGTSMKNTKSD